MLKTIKSIRNIIYIIMYELFLILGYLYFHEIFTRSEKINYPALVVITALCIMDYLSRQYISNVLAFFGVHFLMLGIALLGCKNGVDIILLEIIAGTFLYIGIDFWKGDESGKRLYAVDIPTETIVLFIGVFIHSSIDMSAGLSNYSMIAGICFILLHFLRDYLDKFIAQTVSGGDKADSIMSTFKMNFSFIIFFILIFVLFMIVFTLSFSNNSFNFIGQLVKYIASLIFGFLATFKSDEVISEPETIAGSYNSTTSYNEYTSGAPMEFSQNPIANAIFDIITVVLYIGIALLVLHVIYSFVKEYFNKHRENDDIIEAAEKDVRSKVKTPTVKKKKEHIFMTNKEKIRKLYKNNINHHLKRNDVLHLRASHTTSDIERSISENFKQEKDYIHGLTYIYDIARYSDKEVTKENVKFAKEICNKTNTML